MKLLDSLLRGQSSRVGSAWWIPAQRSTEARRFRRSRFVTKISVGRPIAGRRASQIAPKLGCRVAPAEGGLAMDTRELDRLGDEIAELSAHLDAATARLLELIREFDTREGWNTGFSSCAAWLAWRVGFAPGAAREHVRVARALGTLPRLSHALARGELSYAKVRELTRVATPETEERLLAVGRAGPADHVERIGRGLRPMVRTAQVPADADQPGQSVLEDGARVPAGTSQRLACDASRVVMRHAADGRLLEVARGPARFPRRYGGRSTTGTRAAASRAVGSASDKA